MKNKHIFIISVVLCSIICRVYSTSILLQNLKKGLLDGRCKLHKFGSKIIQHDHYHGDPCQTSEIDYERLSSTTKEDINLQPVEVTSETWDIDIRLGQENTANKPKSSFVIEMYKNKYQQVPVGSSKNLVKVNCNDGVQTKDGCMEEI
ncbi:uncharacterized protein [Euwallacea similis]|uniref:uncharacterized protein n=1 Tax=Euwallacea similis TaxID=1736056 RepID=UPI00344C0BF9